MCRNTLGVAVCWYQIPSYKTIKYIFTYIYRYNLIIIYPSFKVTMLKAQLDLKRLRWWQQLLLILPTPYLASGLLTARDARNGL